MHRRTASRGRAPANKSTKAASTDFGAAETLEWLRGVDFHGIDFHIPKDEIDYYSTAKWFVLCLPLSALLVLFLLQRSPHLTNDGQTAGTTGIITMCCVVAAIYSSMQQLNFQTSLLNVFLAICTFTAAIDLGITGYLLGVWNLGSFYPEHGEKYFASAFGVACLGWDGVVHLLLQGFLCYQAITKQPLSRPVTFIWSGSIINSMMPLLMGAAATGKYSSGVELSTALNAPYVFVPLVITYNAMTARNGGRGQSPPQPSTESLMWPDGPTLLVYFEVYYYHLATSNKVPLSKVQDVPELIRHANSYDGGLRQMQQEMETKYGQSPKHVYKQCQAECGGATATPLQVLWHVKTRRVASWSPVPVCLLVASHGALVLLHVVRTMAVLDSGATVAQQWRTLYEPVLAQPDGTNVILFQCVQSFFT